MVGAGEPTTRPHDHRSRPCRRTDRGRSSMTSWRTPSSSWSGQNSASLRRSGSSCAAHPRWGTYDVRVVQVDDRPFRWAAEQLVGVAHHPLVQLVLARDQHRQAAARRNGRPARPAARTRRWCRGSRTAPRRPGRRCRRPARGRWWRRRRAAAHRTARPRSRVAPRAGSRPGRSGRRRRSSGRTVRRMSSATSSVPRRDRQNTSVRRPASISRDASSAASACTDQRLVGERVVLGRRRGARARPALGPAGAPSSRP